MNANQIIKFLLPVLIAVLTFRISAENPVDSVGTPISAPDTLPKPSTPIRKVTPVDVDEQKPQVTLHYYDKHGNALPEPVKFLATLDTVAKPKSKPVYPLLNGGTIGLNFGDAILMACGQTYGGVDLWGDISLFNWLFPVVEAGVGFAKNTPRNGNFTYKTPPSFYTKIGFNYNFMYKSDPAYQMFLGLRAGYSNFKYDVEGITITDSYWNETQTISMRGLRASAFYGEVLAGIKVKIAGNFSLGWNARYHMKLKVNSRSISTPWYIPGYGANSPFQICVNAMYSFGQKKIEPDTPK